MTKIFSESADMIMRDHLVIVRKDTEADYPDADWGIRCEELLQAVGA